MPGPLRLQQPVGGEEGLATLNTYLSMEVQLMWSQALRYFACCLADKHGFCELYEQLEPYVPDRARRFRLCVRAKRGLHDTAQPGALNIDQAYFKGAMELLQRVDEVDFLDLYCGQLAWEDLKSIRNIARRQVVRLPKFLDTQAKVEVWKRKILEIAAANELSVCSASDMVFKAGKTFFKKEKEKARQGTVVCPKPLQLSGPAGDAAERPADMSRILALSQPKPTYGFGGDSSDEEKAPARTLNMSRLLEMAAPRKSVEPEPAEPPPAKRTGVKKLRKIVDRSTRGRSRRRRWRRRPRTRPTRTSSLRTPGPTGRSHRPQRTTRRRRASSATWTSRA